MTQEVQISDAEAVSIVRNFIKENYKYGESSMARIGYTIEEIEYDENLKCCIIKSEIKTEFDKELYDKISKILDASISDIDSYLSAIRSKFLAILLEEKSKLNKLYFYINSYGKICALFAGRSSELVSELVDKKLIDIDTIKAEEKDVSDIVRKAKKIIGEGTSFKYIDYFPLFVIRTHRKWEMVMFVIYYGRFDFFPKVYISRFSSEGRVLNLKAYDEKDITE